VVPNEATLRKITQVLNQYDIEGETAQDKAGAILIRFKDVNARDELKKVLSNELGEDYIVALNMAQNTPQWLQNLGASPMNLGLDLRGGVHFLLGVDVNQALDPHLKSYVSAFRSDLRKENLKY